MIQIFSRRLPVVLQPGVLLIVVLRPGVFTVSRHLVFFFAGESTQLREPSRGIAIYNIMYRYWNAQLVATRKSLHWNPWNRSKIESWAVPRRYCRAQPDRMECHEIFGLPGRCEQLGLFNGRTCCSACHRTKGKTSLTVRGRYPSRLRLARRPRPHRRAQLMVPNG